MKIFNLLFAAVLSLQTANAGQYYISIGAAKVKKSVLAIPFVKLNGSGGLLDHAKTLHSTLNRDLAFTSLFTIQDTNAFLEPQSAGIALDSFKLSDWTSIGSEFLLKTELAKDGDVLSFEVRLYDVLGGKQILGKKFSAKNNEAVLLAHTAASAVLESLTGKPGMFTSRLAFVCNKSGNKEIYTADFDGANPKQLTHHRSLAFAPAWSPDGKYLSYSLYTKNSKNIKNIDLYEYNFDSGRSVLMSNRQGTNSGASYSPDGSKIALTMSFLGNQEIFALDRSSKQVTKLTQSFGFDVDPAWSPDGKSVAFVSSRAGLPMVYSMNADGSGVKRLTFAGRYNATPSWSPDGKKLAFAGWNEGHFDIFTMNTEGTGLERLTKEEGSNEDAHFSPDGLFVAFSSTRSGQKNIYAISIDGQTTHRLSYGLGQCEAPKWSLPK